MNIIKFILNKKKKKSLIIETVNRDQVSLCVSVRENEKKKKN